MKKNDFREKVACGKKYCLRLLALRPRSEKELVRRLSGRGYDDAVRDEIMYALKKGGMVNDRRFSLEFIDERLRISPRAVRVLRQELLNRGIPENIINDVFMDLSDELNDRKIASGIVAGKLYDSVTGHDMGSKGRLFRFLVSRGFEPEIAEEVINDMVGEQDRMI